ncbi:AMP-binding enzyme, partial [Clostridium perfringens]
MVGYPDPRLNEVAVAFVTGDPEIDVERVRRHCEGRIASFKIPRKVFVVDELPMTASGKVQKEKLRQRALADATAVPGG